MLERVFGLRETHRRVLVLRAEVLRPETRRLEDVRPAVNFVTLKLRVIQRKAPKPQVFHFFVHCFSSEQIRLASLLRNCRSAGVFATLKRRLHRLKNDCFRLMSA